MNFRAAFLSVATLRSVINMLLQKDNEKLAVLIWRCCGCSVSQKGISFWPVNKDEQCKGPDTQLV
jgi:ribosomal protein L37AE/L43A